MCPKGCCEVGRIVYGKNSNFFHNDDDDENSEVNYSDIEHYEAFDGIYSGGHPNYRLPAYCVEIGHYECLKTISKEEGFMYHGDMAFVAIEHDNLECLKYIVEELGDVSFNIDIADVGPNCKEYVEQVLSKLNGETYIDLAVKIF